MLYSAVIQPLPEPFMNAGTDSSTEAVQITRVLPTSINAEPSAMAMKLGTILTGRIWSGARLSERNTRSLLFFNVNQLDAFYGTAQKLLAQAAEFLNRISSITAQRPGVFLTLGASDQLKDFCGG